MEVQPLNKDRHFRDFGLMKEVTNSDIYTK